MLIKNSTIEDITTILELYDQAIVYQAKMGAIQWPKFSSEDIKKEIAATQQWKIIIEDQVVCVWMTTFYDPYIWEEKNKDPSVYIHRIATNPSYRGQHFVEDIITWAQGFSKKHQKKFIRMDTAGRNEKLISYYTQCGFKFLGANSLHNTTNLPLHYHDVPICLFEMKV